MMDANYLFWQSFCNMYIKLDHCYIAKTNNVNYILIKKQLNIQKLYKNHKIRYE